ncbi:FAD-dependent oxidoreductase [Nonomuraea sp. MTCD27]|uniref:FAD-dependent oxidoreductase n=1 Tax=Nonomuraea sp. MTCD27 TaxID=1676747 RepID=UPI0035BFF8D0
MHIAVVGAGMAGLSTAWLLDPDHRITLFETEPRLGGNIHTVTLPTDDGPVTVDLGAQHLALGGYPLLTRLLEILDLSPRRTVPVPLSTTITSAARQTPSLVTPHSPEPGWPRTAVLGDAWESVGTLVARAAEWQDQDISWEQPLAELVEPLPVPRSHKDELLYPWLASFVGCDTAQVREMSARAAVAFLLLVPPDGPEHAPVWHNLRHGLNEVCDALARDLRHTAVRLGIGIRTIHKDDDGRLRLTDTRGETHHADQVVLATPPDLAAAILAPVNGLDTVRTALRAFDYMGVTIAVHADPAYMPAERHHWSTNTITVHDHWAETSTWYGPIHGTDLFKSWITHREPPLRILAQHAFRQLRLTPAAVRARRTLTQAHGTAGIYFAGHYLTGVESQEAALTSAASTCSTLAPDSPRLQRLLGPAQVTAQMNSTRGMAHPLAR